MKHLILILFMLNTQYCCGQYFIQEQYIPKKKAKWTNNISLNKYSVDSLLLNKKIIEKPDSTSYTYNKKGLLTTETRYWFGQEKFPKTYFYNEKAQLIRSEQSYQDKELRLYNVMEQYYYKDNLLFKKKIIKTAPSGNTIYENTQFFTFELLASTKTITRYEKRKRRNKIIDKKIYNNKGLLEYHYVRESNGTRIQYFYTYTFDKKGSWIEKLHYKKEDWLNKKYLGKTIRTFKPI